MPEVVIPYTYRKAFLPFHQRTQRDAVLVCHRRAGKTVALVNDLQLRCLAGVERTFPPPRYAFFYPSRVRAKDIAWPYMKHFSHPIPGRKVSESELSIEYPGGGKITLYGADNSRGVGLWLDGVVYDESDEIPERTVSEIEPTLADYKGWSVFAGMLKGRFNLWKRYEKARLLPNTFAMVLRASESGIIDEKELARQRDRMGAAAYELHFQCNPNASIANAIYGVEMDQMRRENRITRVAFDPTVPLDFFFDIGHSMQGDDWTFWAIQLTGRDILLQDYHACSGKLPAYYAEKVKEMADNNAMAVGTIYLPHDGARMDRQGNSAKDDLMAAGIKRIKIIPRTPNLWDSINNVRALMARMYIDQERCGAGWILGENEMPSGIDCLDFYAKKIEAQTGMVTDIPVHNQYSHGADALRTFVEAYAQNHGMLEGTSDFANRTRLDVSRERTTPERVRRAIHVSR